MALIRTICFALVPLLGSSGVAQQRAPTDVDELKGLDVWNTERINQTIERLDSELGDKSLVFEAFGNYEGHSVYLVLRGRSSPAELHETEADLYVVRRGRATLIVGGQLVDAETRARRQQRGTSIRGGTRREIGPGDVIHIPIGVPHQILFPEGETFLYDLTKFNEEPLVE